MFKSPRDAKLRGGNRLTIDLKYPGSYVITTPIDYDFKVKLAEGDVEYLDDRSVALHVDNPQGCVNRWGDSGGCGERDSWAHYRGDCNPIVNRIKVLIGHITL